MTCFSWRSKVLNDSLKLLRAAQKPMSTGEIKDVLNLNINQLAVLRRWLREAERDGIAIRLGSVDYGKGTKWLLMPEQTDDEAFEEWKLTLAGGVVEIVDEIIKQMKRPVAVDRKVILEAITKSIIEGKQ